MLDATRPCWNRALSEAELAREDRPVQLATTATHEAALAVDQENGPVARFHVAKVLSIPSWSDRRHEGRPARAF